MVTPSTVKLALLKAAPLIRTDPIEFSLVVSLCVTFTPGSVTMRPNISRPFRVMFANWLLSISFEFSLEEVCVNVVVAVTDTCSVIAPSDSEILPKSRTSLAVTSMLDSV